MKIRTSANHIRIVTLLFLFTLCESCSFHGGSPVTKSGTEAIPPANQNQTNRPLPSPNGFVNDYANVFDPASKARLESALIELRDKSSIEFAVVTVETTGGQPIFDYSLAVAKAWGMGPKDKSKGGGLLLMLATRDRQWRLQVSRSLEKDLPDDVCKQFGDKSLDLYRQGKYAEGMTQYARLIVERLEKLRSFKLTREL